MKFIWNDNHMETTFEFGDLHISPDETHGFRPFQLMVSSIVGCSGIIFQQILEKQRTSFDHLSIEAEVERNKAENNRLEKITLIFTVEGKNLNEQKMQRNLDIARKNCAMVQSVQDSIDIEEKLVIVQK